MSSMSTPSPRFVVQVHVACLHLRAAWEYLLDFFAPTEIDILLNAEVRDHEVNMTLSYVVDRIDISRAVPRHTHTECSR